jgi:hypothetical protein
LSLLQHNYKADGFGGINGCGLGLQLVHINYYLIYRVC